MSLTKKELQIRKYEFYVLDGFEVWKNWYKNKYHIRRGTTRLEGFVSRAEANQFIKKYL